MTVHGEPRPTRAGRIVDYLNTMFPPAITVPVLAASFAEVYFGLQGLAGDGAMVVTWRAPLGALTLFLFHLLVRTQDELKDAEDDRRMAETGDPWYTNRPLVTGRVTIGDLTALRWSAIVLTFAINLPMGAPFPLLGFLLGIAVLWLSSRFFFVPAAAGNRIIQFAFGTITYLCFTAYVVTVYVADFGARTLTAHALLLVIGSVTSLLTLEVARKFRHSSQETDAMTYSKIFGERFAALLPGVFALLSAACILPVAVAADSGSVYPGALVAAALLVLGAGLRFRRRPCAERANLMPVTMLFILVVIVGLPLALGLQHGIVF